MTNKFLRPNSGVHFSDSFALLAGRNAFMALMASIAFSTVAQAQTSTGGPKLINTPSEGLANSPGGVDLRTGRFVYNEQDLKIGENSPGGINLVRSMPPVIPGHISPFGNMSHNWVITISEKRVNIQQNYYDNLSGNDFRMLVNRTGLTETFESKLAQTAFGQVSRNAFSTLTFAGNRADPSVVYTFTDEDGTVINFRPMGSGDCAAVLRCAAASDMTTPDGTRYTFDYEYTPAAAGNKARLRKVESSTGYALLLEGIGNYVTKSCVLNLARNPVPANLLCPATAEATTSYGYSGNNLSSITGADGQTESFTYTSVAPNVEMAFYKPGQSAPWLTNVTYQSIDGEGGTQTVVAQQRMATGEQYTYTYYKSPDSTSRPSSIAGGKVTDNLGNFIDVRFQFPILPGTGAGDPCTPAPCVNRRENIIYQQTPGPTAIRDMNGRLWTNDYCDPAALAGLTNYNNRCIVSLLQSTTDPEGIKTTMLTDGKRNVHQWTRRPKVGSPLPNFVTSATYDCINKPKSCKKPTSTTDAKGQATTYTYDATHGGVLTETMPAVGGVNPQKRYEYVQRYAWYKNSAGSFVPSATPMWLLTRERMCRTTAPSGAGCVGGAADEVITDYDYGPDSGPNNLLVRGVIVTADGQSLRTCYGYDAFGRKISETKTAANLTTCQ